MQNLIARPPFLLLPFSQNKKMTFPPYKLESTLTAHEQDVKKIYLPYLKA